MTNPTYELQRIGDGFKVTRIYNGNDNSTIKTQDGGEYTAPLGCTISQEHMDQLTEAGYGLVTFRIRGEDPEWDEAMAPISVDETKALQETMRSHGYDLGADDRTRADAIRATYKAGHSLRRIDHAINHGTYGISGTRATNLAKDRNAIAEIIQRRKAAKNQGAN